MKWHKKQVAIQDIPKLLEATKAIIKTGNEVIEQMRFVFKKEDEDTIYMYMPYDFIDLDPKPSISIFYLYQVLDT